MKLKNTTKFLVAILVTIIIFNICIIKTYANNVTVNENTEQAEKNESESENTKNENKNTTTKTVNKKSSDANITKLTISAGKLNPSFSKDITEYYTEVDLSVTKITTKVNLSNNNAKVTVSGNKNLKEGKNTIELKVTAEDGTQKKYYIYATRTNNTEKSNANLEQLELEDYEITPEFNSSITNYNAIIDKNTDKINVKAVAENNKAQIKISGNEEMTNDENKIEIKVTAEDGKATKTYTINIEKKAEQQQEATEEKKVNVIAENKEPAVIAIGVILIFIILISLKIIKKNKS